MSGAAKLCDHVEALGLPADFCRRLPERTKRVAQLLERYSEQVAGRAFLTGLLFAFLGVAEDLLGQLGRKNLNSALDLHRPEERTPQGKLRNSLYIAGPTNGISLRKYYSASENVIIGGLRRYDYPNCAPHATQAWPQHRDFLEDIFALGPAERKALAEGLWKAVVSLKEFAGRSDAPQTARPFSVTLADFLDTQRGEPAGSVLQGLAFAYYRADAPNVTLETATVGAGSRRTGRVGDVDGWSGADLVLSIEVKDIDVTADNAGQIASAFLANLRDWPDATAIVFARSFTEEAAKLLRSQNPLLLDRAAMQKNVELWDLRKQQLAVRELDYFFGRVQRNSRLVERLETFLEEKGLSTEAIGGGPPAP